MSDINVEKINESLAERFISNNTDMCEAYLIHDPSDIRKPYSKKIENLGKVRGLKGNIINGYILNPNENAENLKTLEK